jgi:TPP-dependent indolepyruvate ferredoxin oxidoreductase alpha subunit
MPAPVQYPFRGAAVGILAYGSTEAAVLEARHQLETQDGLRADIMRIRAIPFTDEVERFLEKYDQVFVVEMNRDGQMDQILKTEYPRHAMKLRSVAYQDGLPASAKWVREGILARYAPNGGPGAKKRGAAKPAARPSAKAKKVSARPASRKTAAAKKKIVDRAKWK